jgi:hypothetical protein
VHFCGNLVFYYQSAERQYVPLFVIVIEDEFLNLCPKLEKLKVLVLQYSDIDNSCLKTIGTWCKNLRYVKFIIFHVDRCGDVRVRVDFP